MTCRTRAHRFWIVPALLVATVVQAQTTPAEAPAGKAAGGGDMLIERLQVDESGVRVDETRVRGETQSITVTPKGRLPAYSLVPATANRPPQSGARDSGGGSATGGARVWNIFGF